MTTAARLADGGYERSKYECYSLRLHGDFKLSSDCKTPPKKCCGSCPNARCDGDLDSHACQRTNRTQILNSSVPTTISSLSIRSAQDHRKTNLKCRKKKNNKLDDANEVMPLVEKAVQS
ncbi:hypothetical protein E2C01_042865 [Portunus trituberculatus]|uniref:Uncharacterized protein n=1 Tax=Portunus trituberculatus TaxID=210409 RepID=A0A5B7FXN6_PORTR|nr:hypothetical protein [Portunus trituberculatus]